MPIKQCMMNTCYNVKNKIIPSILARAVVIGLLTLPAQASDISVTGHDGYFEVNITKDSSKPEIRKFTMLSDSSLYLEAVDVDGDISHFFVEQYDSEDCDSIERRVGFKQYQGLIKKIEERIPVPTNKLNPGTTKKSFRAIVYDTNSSSKSECMNVTYEISD
ncbi:MAG: hypothetical protein AABW49_04840 [Nanoarchaeota archaeon]